MSLYYTGAEMVGTLPHRWNECLRVCIVQTRRIVQFRKTHIVYINVLTAAEN